METETPHGDQDPPEASVPPPPPEVAPPLAGGRAHLRRRRRELLNRRAQAVYHLGGLAFELFRRDLLTEQVMRVRAEEVAELDRSVREIDERLLQLAERPPKVARTRKAKEEPAGECPSCGSPHTSVAAYCWNCGVKLPAPEPEASDASEAPTGVVDGSEQPTEVIAVDREEGS
jgi:hypothetical protein